MQVIETERLLLTPWEATEEMAVALFEYAKNPEVGPAAGWKPHENPKESMDIITNLFIPDDEFAIRIKETGEIIGSIGLMPDIRRPGIESRELGYSLARNWWGRGLMTEAAKAVIDYGFNEFKLEIIAITINPSNKRSQSVARKCGFKYEGTQRMACKGYDGTYRDSMLGSITREEWQR